MKVILLAALFSLTIHDMMSPTSASYGTPSEESRFPGKRPSKIKVVKNQEVPWRATVLHKYDEEWQFCPGTLINNWIVITAARCVFPRGGEYGAKLGNTKDRNLRIQVAGLSWASIRVYNRFKGPLEGNDIALLKLPPVNVRPHLTPYIQPAHLPRNEPPIGTKLTFVARIGETLHSTELKSLSNKDARKKLVKLMKNPKTLEGIKADPLFKSFALSSKNNDDFKNKLLEFVKNNFHDTEYIFTKKEKTFGPCGGGAGLIYQEEIGGNKRALLAAVTSFPFGPCEGEETVTVSTRVGAFCKKRYGFCAGTGQQHLQG